MDPYWTVLGVSMIIAVILTYAYVNFDVKVKEDSKSDPDIGNEKMTKNKANANLSEFHECSYFYEIVEKACQANDLEMLKTLIGRGYQSEEIMWHALDSQSNDIMNYLFSLSNFDLDQRFTTYYPLEEEIENEVNAVQHCCMKGYSDKFDILVEGGAVVASTAQLRDCSSGEIEAVSSLQLAARSGHLNLARKLIHHGVTVTEEDISDILGNWTDRPEDTVKTVEALLKVYQPTRENVSEARLFSTKLEEMFQSAASKPHSLQQLSRNRVRGRLQEKSGGRSIRPLIEDLQGEDISRVAVELLLDV